MVVALAADDTGNCTHTNGSKLPSIRAETIATLSSFYSNDFDVKIFYKTQHMQFKINLSHEQPSSNTTLEKFRDDIICVAEVLNLGF